MNFPILTKELHRITPWFTHRAQSNCQDSIFWVGFQVFDLIAGASNPSEFRI